MVAQTPSDDPDDKTKLYGSWAPVPAMPDGGGKAVAQTKLGSGPRLPSTTPATQAVPGTSGSPITLPAILVCQSPGPGDLL